MNALFGGVENFEKLKPLLDVVMRTQPILTEKRDPKDLSITDQMQADVDGFTQQNKRPRAISSATTTTTASSSSSSPSIIAGTSMTPVPAPARAPVASDTSTMTAVTMEAPPSPPHMMPMPMWMFPPMQGAQGQPLPAELPMPSQQGDFPMTFMPPPFYPHPPFYGWMPHSSQPQPQPQPQPPQTMSQADPEMYSGGLNHVFLQLKQLLDMHDQERMNWFTHCDQIARAIALLQHQFDEYDLKKEDAAISTLLQTATSKPLVASSKDRLLLDEQRVQLDKELSYLHELMAMPTGVKKSTAPPATAAGTKLPDSAGVANMNTNASQKTTIQYVIQL